MPAQWVVTQDALLASLTRFPGNARRGDVRAIAASLHRHGQYRALVVRDLGSEGRVIVAGNHTRDAMELLYGGWLPEGADPATSWAGRPEVARCELIRCSDDEARRINLADNRLAELPGPDGSRYDDDELVQLLSYLDDDYEGTGWTAEDVEALIAPPEDFGGGGGDPDDVPEPPAEPVSAPGDLVLLGPHRLLVGDSTDPADIVRLMDGQMADMVFTDPPYNADYSSRVDKQRRKPWGGIANDAMPEAEYEAFLAKAFAVIPKVTMADAAVYVWTDWHHYSLVERVFRERFLQKSMIVWDKGHFGLGTYYRTQHELCLFGVNGSRVETWNAGHDERDVWSVSRDPTSEYAHPTQKPCELAERAITNSSAWNGIVLDLFGGSGSTLIAAHRTGRMARLCELDPKFADVIIQRWIAQTGQAATYEDGSPWPSPERAQELASASSA